MENKINMELQFSDDVAWIYKGDATNMNEIRDGKIDCIICDPPYGISYVSGHRTMSLKSRVATNNRFTPIANDESFPAKIMNDSLWEMYRVLKQDTAVYIFTRWDIQDRLIKLVEELFEVRNVLIWYKDNWSAGDTEGNYGYEYESIIYACKGDHKLIGTRPHNVLPFKRVDGKSLLHPAQKPTPLLSFLISKSCPTEGIILDPFAGSFSTIVAAHQMGIRSVGIDLDSNNTDIGIKRLKQKELFTDNVNTVQDHNWQTAFV